MSWFDPRCKHFWCGHKREDHGKNAGPCTKCRCDQYEADW
jgi:hypothetical protein